MIVFVLVMFFTKNIEISNHACNVFILHISKNKSLVNMTVYTSAWASTCIPFISASSYCC